MVFCVLLFLQQISGFDILAQTNVVIVSLSPEKSYATAKETIPVPVVFSTIPEIVKFGPVKIGFDPRYVSYSALEPGAGLAQEFHFSQESGMDYVEVSAEYLYPAKDSSDPSGPTGSAESSGTESAGAGGSAETESIFSAETPSVAFVLQFTVQTDAPGGDALFTILDTGSFTDVHEQSVNSGSGGQARVRIDSSLSADATLKSLALEEGYSLDPPFSPDRFSYSVRVPRYVGSLSALPEASDSRAEIVIWGGQKLEIGENNILIDVTAEDRLTRVQYSITVERTEYQVIENAIITDRTGKVFWLVEPPEDFTVPAGYRQRIIRFQEQEMLVCVLTGTDNFLVFAREDEAEDRLYFNVHSTGEMVPYDPNLIYFFGAKVFFISEPAEEIPPNYQRSSLIYEDRTLPVYIHADENSYLLYLKNESGIEEFYFFDRESGFIFPFSEIESDSNYFIPFLFVGGFSLLEFAVVLLLLRNTKAPSDGSKKNMKGESSENKELFEGR